VQPVDKFNERDVLAARLARTADCRKALRVFNDFCRGQMRGDASVVLQRDRRSEVFTTVARSGTGLSVADAPLLYSLEAREPPHRLHRIARPIRPHGRLFGGTVVLRVEHLFTLADATRLGSLSRTLSAELERRDRIALERALHRLYRKLARGVAARDVLYHVLDEAVRLTAADHSAAVLVADPSRRWHVLAEKLFRGRSERIGLVVDDRQAREPSLDPEVSTSSMHSLWADCVRSSGPRLLLGVWAASGDRFDEWDQTVVDRLVQPAAVAVDRILDGSRERGFPG
jgi:hypothetical protein